jgi:hypothetical protein
MKPMNQNDYKELLKEGTGLVEEILKDLNATIPFNRTDATYRREEDINEICVAIALYQRRLTHGFNSLLNAVRK